jgi:hypothetical protein
MGRVFSILNSGIGISMVVKRVEITSGAKGCTGLKGFMNIKAEHDYFGVPGMYRPIRALRPHIPIEASYKPIRVLTPQYTYEASMYIEAVHTY